MAAGTDYGRMERIAFQAESYVLVIDGEHINVGAVIRALYTDHRRLAREAAKLVEAVKPFAEYIADGGDHDDKGEPLPDTQGVGWVYLTFGDFRRARAAMTEAGQ